MPRTLTNRTYLSVVIPFMISTMTQPLMGAVDTAMMGTLSNPAYISGVALGTVLFNTIYWLFGFLRVGTTGYSAQALGSGEELDKIASFGRPLILAAVFGLAILIFQAPILQSYIALVAPESDVAGFTSQYFHILVWGAPFTLFNYVSLGWLMGQSRLKFSLFMQISGNVLNIILCILMVSVLKLEVKGVACATLAAQAYTCIVGFVLMRRCGAFSVGRIPWAFLLDLRAFIDLLKTNGNLMLRTACLLVVNNLFAATSASFGTVVLAANAVLLQIQGIMSYLIDGMANGNSLFTGRAVGCGDKKLFEATRAMCLKWLAVLVLILAGTYGLLGQSLLTVFTSNQEVVATAHKYSLYILFYPLCASIGITYYGMFTGATFTSPVRDMMFLAMLCFIAARTLLVPALGNDGLWASYLIFYASQSFIMLMFFGRLRKKTGFIRERH